MAQSSASLTSRKEVKGVLSRISKTGHGREPTRPAHAAS